jgi:hypothetical protein
MLRRFWPFLVPPAFFLVLLVLQPADRFVLPEEKPVPGYPLHGNGTRLLADDSDVLAFAIRAENAARGRKAGLVGELPFDSTTGWHTKERNENTVWRVAPYEPELTYKQREFEDRLTRPATFAERYFQEYPPAALYLFRLGLIGSGRSDTLNIHPAILDSHQYNVALHVPAPGDEQTLYRALRHATRVYGFIMLAALVGLIVLIDRGIGANGEARGPVWLLVLPGFLYFTPCRFDILPAALVLCSIAAADRRRVWLSGGCIGLAVALKMYPLALTPLILRYAARSWGQAFEWCMALAVPLVLSYGIMYVTDGIEGVTVPLKYQLSRVPEPEWCFYGRFLPADWTFRTPTSSLMRAVPVLAVVLLMTLRRSPNVESLLRRCAIAMILFLTFQVFYSPQWWLWLAVLLVPLVPRHRWLVAYIVAHDLLTYFHFPVLFDTLTTDMMAQWDQWAEDKYGEKATVGGAIRSIHVWVRAAMWFGLLAVFARTEARGAVNPPNGP